MRKVGLVILNYNSSEYLEILLESLTKVKTNTSFYVGVLDNGSNISDKKFCKKLAYSYIGDDKRINGFFISSDNNLGFSGGNNLVIDRFLQDSSITHICLINSDVIVTDYWLDYLLEGNYDVVGPVTNSAGNEQTVSIDYEYSKSFSAISSANVFSHKRHLIYGNYSCDTDVLYFFCTLFKRSIIEKIGLLDEQFFPGSYEDNDFCLRIIKAGYKLTIKRGCYVHHFGSGSFSKLLMPRRIDIANKNRQKFEQKWNIQSKDPSSKNAMSARIDLDFFTGKSGDPWAFSLIMKSMKQIELTIEEWAKAISNYQSNETINGIHDDSRAASSFNPTENSTHLLSLGDTNEILYSISGKKLLKFAIIKAINKIQRIIHFQDLVKFLNIKENEDPDYLKRLFTSVSESKGKIVCIFAPIFTRENERDGYFQRVKEIDSRIFHDYFRIYLYDDTNLSSRIRISYHGKDKAQIIFNSHDLDHRAQVFSLVKSCKLIYVHSILRFMTDSVHKNMLDIFKLNGIKRIWDVHGAVPEEYSLSGSHHSRLIADAIEKYFYFHTDTIVVVSFAMKDHLQKKYGITTAKFIVLPILSKNLRDELGLNNYNKPLIEQKNNIVYSGGLQKWQNIELMQRIITSTAHLFNYSIFVPNKPEFLRLLGSKQDVINKIRVDSVSPEEIALEYKSYHYGFILRDSITVNFVACPTKIIEYINYGIVPIFKSDDIGDFKNFGIEFIHYKDLINMNLPSEEKRQKMANKNTDILKHLIQIGDEGEQCLRKSLIQNDETNIISSEVKQSRKGAIGLVVNSFDKGGLEQAVYNLYIGYKEHGYDTYILCQSNTAGHFAKKLESPEHLLMFNNDEATFIKYCHLNNIKCLHYHYNTFFLNQLKSLGIYSIYSLQNVYTWLSDDEIRARALLINSADFVVAGSTFSKEYYCQRTNTPSNRVEVIPIGVNTDDLNLHDLDDLYTRKSLGIKDEEITLGFIASFHEVKHQMNMIGAMEIISKVDSRLKLIFVGNVGHADYFNKVKNAWENSQIKDKIIHIPFIDHTQLGEFLRETIDIFILPSMQEGCSNAVIDALYCGKPMLLTDVGNASDLRHLGSVTIVSRAYPDLFTFRQRDISRLCLEKTNINTQEIVDGLLDIVNNLSERKIAAELAAKKFSKSCDKREMVCKYIQLMKNFNID